MPRWDWLIVGAGFTGAVLAERIATQLDQSVLVIVDGLASADTIVVHGAGVLWSLQGLGSFSAAEEEHD